MNDDRIIELLSDLLDESRGTNKRLDRIENEVVELKTEVVDLKTEVVELKTEVVELKTEVTVIKRDVGRLQKQQADTNVAMHQMRLAVYSLADRFESVLDFGQRLARVEAAVFKN